ncbi:MAG: hypothetical protein BGN92_14250 [Sphingobacteriales bacterium 41-5]|nr:MAG: hypothetical protein BGN92_14250 [Sphingobacteriales bacterium 41-5]
MSGAKYIADTSAFINLLKQHSGLQPLLNATWHYCFITEIELLGKPGITSAEIKIIKELLSTCVKILHTDDITKEAVSIKQQYS